MATMSNLATEKRDARVRVTQENRRVELTLMHWGDTQGYAVDDILYHPQLFSDFLKDNHKVFEFLYLLECPSLWTVLEFDDTFSLSHWEAGSDVLNSEGVKTKVFGLIEEIKSDLKTWLESQEDISDLDELSEVYRVWSLGENKVTIRLSTNYEDKNILQVLICWDDL